MGTRLVESAGSASKRGCNPATLEAGKYHLTATIRFSNGETQKDSLTINVLPSPLATVIFHYHKSDAYAPEYASAVVPNQKQSEIERLRGEYGAKPLGLRDVVLLAPEAKVEQRRREFPGITVEPIKFASSELGADSWKFLLGAYGNDALYIRQLVAIMRRHRSGLVAGFDDGRVPLGSPA